MDQGKSKLAATLFAAALTTAAAPLHASVPYVPSYAETGDAGQTLATAQTVPGSAGSTVTSITGTIGSPTDADLYLLTMPATTGGSSIQFTVTSASGIDTQIFLFSPTGTALFGNDDGSNTSLNPSLTVSGLAAGNYYLGISLSGNDPTNSAGQLLFTGDQPTTNVRTAAGGVNPTTLSNFDGSTFVAEVGPYGIAIAAIPEPTTTAALALGGLVSLTLVRRLRRQQTV